MRAPERQNSSLECSAFWRWIERLRSFLLLYFFCDARFATFSGFLVLGSGEPDFLIRMRLRVGHLMFRTSIPFVFDMAAVVPCPSRSKPCLI